MCFAISTTTTVQHFIEKKVMKSKPIDWFCVFGYFDFIWLALNIYSYGWKSMWVSVCALNIATRCERHDKIWHELSYNFGTRKSVELPLQNKKKNNWEKEENQIIDRSMQHFCLFFLRLCIVIGCV